MRARKVYTAVILPRTIYMNANIISNIVYSPVVHYYLENTLWVKSSTSRAFCYREWTCNLSLCSTGLILNSPMIWRCKISVCVLQKHNLFCAQFFYGLISITLVLVQLSLLLNTQASCTGATRWLHYIAVYLKFNDTIVVHFLIHETGHSISFTWFRLLRAIDKHLKHSIEGIQHLKSTQWITENHPRALIQLQFSG